MCALAIVDMVTSTGMVVLNVAALILTAGAGSAAVKAGMVAKSAAGAVAKKTVSQAAIAAAKSHIQKNAVKLGVALSTDALNLASKATAQAKEDGEFDYTVLDPTGIAAVIQAFNKPICGKTQTTVNSDSQDNQLRKWPVPEKADRGKE